MQFNENVCNMKEFLLSTHSVKIAHKTLVVGFIFCLHAHTNLPRLHKRILYVNTEHYTLIYFFYFSKQKVSTSFSKNNERG